MVAVVGVVIVAVIVAVAVGVVIVVVVMVVFVAVDCWRCCSFVLLIFLFDFELYCSGITLIVILLQA